MTNKAHPQDAAQEDLTDAEMREHFGKWPMTDEEILSANSFRQGRISKKVLGKPCHDCAVTFGLYTAYAQSLRQIEPIRRGQMLLQWFCHNSPDRACAGAAKCANAAQEGTMT